MGTGSDRGGIRGLSERMGAELALVPPTTPTAAAQVGQTVYVEDIRQVTVHVKAGGNGLTVCRVEGNAFSPLASSTHWQTVEDIGAMAASDYQKRTVSPSAFRFFRLVAQGAAGGGTVDLSYSGA